MRKGTYEYIEARVWSTSSQHEQDHTALRTDQPYKQQRRYREDVPYALPKDLEEGQRLNLQHYLFRYVLHGNYVAPLPETVASILDVGSGTGIWGQEMAQRFPLAEVFGVDLEPPHAVSLAASVAPLPTNYHFVQANILERLPFPDKLFDYTHQRMLVLAIPWHRWPGMIEELVRVTRPGGWIELLEAVSEIRPAGPATTQLRTWSFSFLKARGIDPSEMRSVGRLLSQGGVRQCTTRVLDIPLGSWHRHIGTLLEKDIAAAYRATSQNTCQTAGISPEQFEQYLQEAIQEWNRGKAVYRFYLAYGHV